MSVNVFKVEKICSRLKDIAFLVEQIALLHRMSKLKTDEYLKALEDSLAKIEKEHSDNIGVFNAVPRMERYYNVLKESISRYYETVKNPSGSSLEEQNCLQ